MKICQAAFAGHVSVLMSLHNTSIRHAHELRHKQSMLFVQPSKSSRICNFLSRKSPGYRAHQLGGTESTGHAVNSSSFEPARIYYRFYSHAMVQMSPGCWRSFNLIIFALREILTTSILSDIQLPERRLYNRFFPVKTIGKVSRAENIPNSIFS